MNTKHYILLMAAALTMAGCAFDDPMEKQKPWEENDSELPKPVTFSVSTANNVDFTRAAESIVTFNKDEKIRVLVKPLGSEAYTPYDYTTVEKGQSVALKAPDPQPYFPAGVHTTIDAYAYYPATASTGSVTAFTVADYQRDSADYKASDLMMADNRTITKGIEDGSNSLTMKHLMAQLRVKAVPDSASDLKITKILVEARRSLYFTPEGETVAETTGEKDVITVLNEIDLAGGTGGEGYILIPPQAINGVTIKVVTGSGRPREIATYSFTADGNFQAGASYGVDITVTPEQMGFTTAIANWNGMGSVIIAPSGDLVIEPIDAQQYVDKWTPITPKLVVRKGADTLKVNTHYKVEYLNNTVVGTAYAVVTGLKSSLAPDHPDYFDYTNSCGVAPFKITSAIATISYGESADTTVVYGCQPFIYEHLFNGGDGTVTYTSDDPSIATVNAITGQVTPVRSGTTTIRATVADGANYVYNDDAREATYTIHVSKAAGSIKFDEKTPSQAWNADDSQNHFTQAVTHVGNGTVTYTVPATTSAENTCGATIDGSTVHFTKGGQVVVTATVEDNDYYTYDAENRTATYTLTVTKALGFINLTEYSGSVPYDETKMLFTIAAGQTHGGTVTVASSDETIATVTFSGGHVHAKGVKAGETKIVVTCAETAQYQEAKVEYTLTVGKIAITGMTAPTARDLTYTGSPQPLVNVGSVADGQGRMQYRLGTNQVWSDNVPEVTNAGTYQVYWQVAGDANHSTYTPQEPVVVTIAKANPTYTAPAVVNNLTYNGSGQALVTAGSTNHGYILFSLSSTSGWGSGVPAKTDAGTYTVYWKVVGDANHNNVDAQSLSATIAQASAGLTTAPTAKTNLTYSGSAQQLVNGGSVSHGSISYSIDNGSTWLSGIPTGTNAGTYTVYYKVTGTNGNYADIGKTKVGDIAIAKKSITSDDITLGSKALTYNGASQTRDVSTVAGLSASGNWSVTGGNTGTNAGDYTLTVEMASTCQNYKGSATKGWSIARKAVTLTFASATISKSYVWEVKGVSNTLTKSDNSATITYSSTNTGIASVSSTGVLTPGGSTGSATIKVEATGNYSGSATYTLTAGSKTREFAYTGGVQSVTVPAGTYKLEVWGAQGGMGYQGYNANMAKYAKGGYSSGNKTITSQQTFYVCVGGQGTCGIYYSDSRAVGATAGGYNGGGKGGGSSTNPSAIAGGAGGGATHIALTYSGTLYELLNNSTKKSYVLIVAGGGGGCTDHQIGGHGGGATGGASADGYPYGAAGNAYSYNIPSQAGATSSNYYALGLGQNGYSKTQFNGWGTSGTGGGGGGYYGGKAYQGQGQYTDVGGGGGAGYVGGVSGGSTSAGQRAGHGLARITWVSN